MNAIQSIAQMSFFFTQMRIKSLIFFAVEVEFIEFSWPERFIFVIFAIDIIQPINSIKDWPVFNLIDPRTPLKNLPGKRSEGKVLQILQPEKFGTF